MQYAKNNQKIYLYLYADITYVLVVPLRSTLWMEVLIHLYVRYVWWRLNLMNKLLHIFNLPLRGTTIKTRRKIKLLNLRNQNHRRKNQIYRKIAVKFIMRLLCIIVSTVVRRIYAHSAFSHLSIIRIEWLHWKKPCKTSRRRWNRK